MEKSFGPVRLIGGANSGKYPHSNSLYVEGAGVLIDAGADAEAYRRLRQGPGVKEVWLSHWHEDHITYLDLFADLPLVQMQVEAPALLSEAAFIEWYGIANPEFHDYWHAKLRDDFNFKPRRASRYFTPGDIIDLGSCTVEVIAAPGHTPGHCAFFFREPAVLFMADYDLTSFGPWYGDRDSSIDLTIDSVRRLRQIPAKVWLTSHDHGCFESDPGELFDRYLDVIEQRESKLLDCLKVPRSLEEVGAQCIVYRKPRQPRAFFEWGEQAIMGKHLQRLLAQGRIKRDEAGRYSLA